MVGGERVRFCPRCELNVYNLSGMSKVEAEALLVNREGRLCVRYFRRADGSILTKNCPVGLRALRRKAARAAGAFLSAVLSFGAGVGGSRAVRMEGPGPEVERLEEAVVMGDVAVTEEPTATLLLPADTEDPGFEVVGQLAETASADRQSVMGRIAVPVRQPKPAQQNHKR